MLTSWSEVSTPAELSMASVLIRPPVRRERDAAGLGQAEIGALADHLDAQLGAVDADGVVGLVADLGVGLGRRLHIGADAAEVEQLGRRLEDGAASASAGRHGVSVTSEQRRAPPASAGST